MTLQASQLVFETAGLTAVGPDPGANLAHQRVFFRPDDEIRESSTGGTPLPDTAGKLRLQPGDALLQLFHSARHVLDGFPCRPPIQHSEKVLYG